MNKIKHSKYKNTGILFELLVRQVASDTVSGKDSAAVGLMKKYFSKSELAKEYKIYQALVNTKALSESKAESLVNATLEIQYAAAYNLIEAHNSLEFVEPSQVIENKVTLLEYITRKEVKKEDVKDRVLEEYAKMDKGTRILAYKMLLEKFNEKYGDLSSPQKAVLKEYINNISNNVKLREFVNNHYAAIKAELGTLNKSVTDKTIQIKINEVVNLLKPLDKNQNVKDDNIVALLQFHQLVEELKAVK